MRCFLSKISTFYYGSIQALRDISFHVNEGEIVTLIGANGAGKTTTMHAISGLLKAQSGEIDYCGQNISKMEAHKIIRLGLAQVPEGRRVFSGLTVMQNLQMGAYTRRDGKEAIQNDYDMVFDLLPRLKERRNQPAGTLSGGEQQMLAMGRALMCKPKMLLLDEPSMGLSPLLVKEIFKIIRQVNRNRCDRATGGAERQNGPGDRQPCLRAGDRQDQDGRRSPRACQQHRGPQSLPRLRISKTKRPVPADRPFLYAAYYAAAL